MIKQSNRQSGFTIVELLIATVVFSMVLLIISGALIQIGRLYTKGLTAARTQEVARTTLNDISQAIQFNNGAIRDTPLEDVEPVGSSKSESNCVVGRHYSYSLGYRVGGNQHGLLVKDVSEGCTGLKAQDLASTSANGKELLGENMRLSKFDVDEYATNAYTVTVGILYGDDGLMCSESIVTGSCNGEGADLTPAQIADAARNGDLKCKNIREGSQFCASSVLSTKVERRIGSE